MKNGLWLYLLVAYALTIPLSFIGERFQASSDLVAYLRITCLLAFAACALPLYRGRGVTPAARMALAAAIGTTWSCLLAMELYRFFTMIPFTFSFVISSMADTKRTLSQVLGAFGSGYAAGALILVLSVSAAAAWWLLRASERLLAMALRPAVTLACVAPLAYLAAADARYITEELVVFGRGHFNELPLRTPDYSALPVAARESVFILQLESVNSAVLFERDGETGFRRRVAMPGLEAVVREGGGVLFPFFWANGMQTNRAQEAILCAISGNAGQAISIDPLRLQRGTCLPRHLAQAGFSTVFLYSYFDLDFFNFAQFQKAMGFGALVHGEELMRAGDRRHAWGYDDCVFYERAFDYLERRDLARRDRLFAYFEVGTNHAPFGGPPKYPDVHPYPAADGLTEHYVNSLAEQDHCLATFWKRFKALARDDVHLIIVPDHSIWMGGIPDPDAVFTSWMAYVPPARRKAQFKPQAVLQPMPSQAQIYPTVLELLGSPRSRDSFAFALRGEPTPTDYDDCHLLADPYSRLLVVGRNRRAEYLLQTGVVRLPGNVTEKMDYWTFQERYGCAPTSSSPPSSTAQRSP